MKITRSNDARFFAIVVWAAAVDGALFTAIRAAQPAVIQGGGDFLLILTQHRDRFTRICDLLRLADLAPIQDWIPFEEFDQERSVTHLGVLHS